eukprot:scaffold76001_cov30-Tisochrysis_lutea.AAC.3
MRARASVTCQGDVRAGVGTPPPAAADASAIARRCEIEPSARAERNATQAVSRKAPRSARFASPSIHSAAAA